MKLALFVSLIIFISPSCSQKGFIRVSKKIEKECTSVKGRRKGTSFHELRTKLYNEGKLNFINSNADTLYILETYEIESGTYLSSIWNRKDVLNYTYNRNIFSFDQQKLFTNYTVQLVQNWDTATIRKEESVNANSLPERYIYATRVSIANAKTKIECIKFREFFKLERDR
jgi:hypothetical protein